MKYLFKELVLSYVIILYHTLSMEKSMKERTKEDNDALYISASKANIDSNIATNNYRSAFGLLLLVLSRLDDGKQKNEFISHYLNDFFILNPNI